MIRAPTARAAARQLRTFASTARQWQPSTNTISAAEIAHFSSLSAHWWDPTGEFALLHRMNPARIQFVRDSILRQHELDGANPGRWLEGMAVLDVGCGGGIFAEVSSLASVASTGASSLTLKSP